MPSKSGHTLPPMIVCWPWRANEPAASQRHTLQCKHRLYTITSFVTSRDAGDANLVIKQNHTSIDFVNLNHFFLSEGKFLMIYFS